MTTEKKQSVPNGIGRMIFVLLGLFFQVFWVFILFWRLNVYSGWISLGTSILALVLSLRIYGKHINAAFKLPWIILILFQPILGICLYLLIGRSGATRKTRERFTAIDYRLRGELPQDPEVLRALEDSDILTANQARYIWRAGRFPLYRNEGLTYYSDAAEALEAQKAAMAGARSFIFLEYHAIEDSRAFAGVKEILARKAKEGVEVRIVYDDVGSLGFINTDFIQRMEKLGIQCRVFNRILPVLNVFMNNRDHRKMTVVDGEIAFTGGYNLADEYFNLTHPYGEWKDCGIRLEGAAVRSMTAMFLEMWNAIRPTDADLRPYLPPPVPSGADRGMGYLQPYADSPLDEEYLGENVYMNMVKSAKHRVWFTTPYLILDDEMSRELGQAARRGVDVRIAVPGIPDKKVIYQVTRSYYAALARCGVRIYEFTPGFLHAKQCVCDGEKAAVGTINLDFRSLYLHFENGVFFCGCTAVNDVEEDCRGVFSRSLEVTEKYRIGRSSALRIGQCILRLFSPLM